MGVIDADVWRFNGTGGRVLVIDDAKRQADKVRRALEAESVQLAMLRGAHHVLNLLLPYLEQGQRMHLLGLVGAYSGSDNG